MPRVARVILALMVAAPVWAQEAPESDEKTTPDKATTKTETENAEAGKEGGRVVKSDKDKEVKVLKPKDVPAELGRLKSKADIKAEITVRPHHGRPAIFKGVIRNGKLIERFAKRRFRSEKSVEHPRCGVRLWWIGNASGWMFFRYTNIQSIALTGRLTDEERAEIMARLKARSPDEVGKKEASALVDLEKQLDKLTPAELGSYLLRSFPEKDGWNRKRHRALKKKQIIENRPLDRDEAIFVKHYNALMRARLNKLKTSKRKVEIEPGSREEPRNDTGDASGTGNGIGLPPGTGEPSGDDG